MTEVFAWWLAQVGSAILILVETYVHWLAVASGQKQLNKFSCPHLEKVKDNVPSREEHHLNSEKLAEYPGGADILRNMTDAADYAKQLSVAQVTRVSESSYVVCGIPDTSARTGFVHVKNHNDTLLCSVKHCRIFSGGKQLKTRYVCLHVHLLSCSLGLWKLPSPAIASSTTPTAAVSTCTSTETSSTIPTSSVARTSTLKLNQATQYPYHIPLSIISASRNADSRTLCGMDGQRSLLLLMWSASYVGPGFIHQDATLVHREKLF